MEDAVLVLEEGMPNFIEQELKALAYDRALSVRIEGKDTVMQTTCKMDRP